MSVLPRSITSLAPAARAAAVAALVGVSLMAGPLSAAHAGTAAQSAKADTRAETVEQRIATLHTQLKITADEESKWNDVAQAMRENAAQMEKLSADRAKQGAQSMTAMDDLKGYEKFAQAHVDGLKNLISSFQVLYDSMPDPQKKTADQVFQANGQKGRPSNS